ncbi:hypothetical protein COOONC_01405 [Cooperia oncophora]
MLHWVHEKYATTSFHVQHMNETELPAVKSAIYQGLVALYPKQAFTVVCVDGAVSYQADSNRYCVEGNMDHNCYVFML